MLESVIEDAFEELAAGGTPPSVRQVRAFIGSGSMTQINEVVGRLKAQYLMRSSSHHEVPDDMRERGERLIAQMWSFLKTESDNQLEEARRSTGLRAAELEAALKESYEDSDKMQRRVDELERQCAELSGRLSAELEIASATKLELAVCRQRFEDSEIRAAALQRVVENLSAGFSEPRVAPLVFGQDGPLRSSTVDAVGDILGDYIARNGPIADREIAAKVRPLSEAPSKRLSTAIAKLLQTGRLSRDATGALAMPAQPSLPGG